MSDFVRRLYVLKRADEVPDYGRRLSAVRSRPPCVFVDERMFLCGRTDTRRPPGALGHPPMRPLERETRSTPSRGPKDCLVG